jgi:hypothetical protein
MLPKSLTTRVAAAALALAPAVLGGPIANSASIDTVYVRDLNHGFASCNPISHTYWHNATRTVYFGASIVCQPTVAYITYTSKRPFA